MRQATAPYTEELISVAGTGLQVFKTGSGPTLIIFHDEIGQHAWLRYREALSEHFEAWAPSHPGYGKSPRLDWIMTMRDMAGWHLQAFDELWGTGCQRGRFSLGGWLAATIAWLCPHHCRKLALVGAAGIKPRRVRSSIRLWRRPPNT